MQFKAYATTLMTAAGGLFFGVVALNLFIDPLGVFGTGMLEASPNINARFAQFDAYRRESVRYDGLLLGSSRAFFGIPIEDLSRRTGIKFASFAVGAGRLEDHALVLDYVAHQKRRDGERLRAVLLLLDVDRLGDPPQAARKLLQPPALTGENPARFWWRNLTQVQWRSWRQDLLRAWNRGRSATATKSAGFLRDLPDSIWSQIELGPSVALAAGATARKGLDPITTTRHFSDQLTILSRIVALCRENHVELHTVVSPISRSDMARIDREELKDAVDQISRIVPIWDFSREDWLWVHPEYWLDPSHYSSEVGRKMLARILGDSLEEPWRNFGRLTGAPAQDVK
jgi:hypothetical protein